jgi:hypothetical protein
MGVGGPSGWAATAGLRPSFLSPIFFLLSFLFYFQFQLSNLNSNLLAGFRIWATYEIGLDVQ